jgi:flagellar hook-associated protein 3 FlgL
MSFVSIGDQSTAFITLRHNSRLKAEIQRLGQELASGRKARPGAETSGDTAYLSGVERSLSVLGGYRTATAEARLFASIAQDALGAVQAVATGFHAALAAAGTVATVPELAGATSEAEARFRTVVATLNVRAGDRAVFGGTATGTAPLADAETMLAALRTAAAAETTADGIETVVNDWFLASGGGFETTGYQGSTAGTVTFRIGDGEDTGIKFNAADPDLRGLMRSFALAAMASGLADASEQALLMRRAGEYMANGVDGLTGIRAAIGAEEARIEDASARHSASETALGLARAAFSAIDPYEVATAFEQANTQLETLYGVTVRMSRLTLAEFLR